MESSEQNPESMVAIKPIRRRPVIAGLLALVGPGLGHLYSGRIQAALLWLCVYLVGLNLSFALFLYWDEDPLNVFLPAIIIVVLELGHIFHAAWIAKRQPVPYVPCAYNRWYYYLAWWVGTYLFTVVAFPIFGSYEAFRIPVSSMENTLLVGDCFHVDMTPFDDSGLSRGDVVVFYFPGDGETRYIKRCIALPADTVSIIDKQLFINGQPAEEPATIKFADTTASGEQNIRPRVNGKNSRDNFGPFVVPADSYFMLGDNRDNSYDSRFWGTVSGDLVLGKAARIYYSSDWDRIGRAIE